MKMTYSANSGKKAGRILAVLLSALMVLTVIPFSALGVMADSTVYSTYVHTINESAFSGQTITVNGGVDSPTIDTDKIQNYNYPDGYYRIKITERSFLEVIASDMTSVADNAIPVKASGVSVSAVTAQKVPEGSLATTYSKYVVEEANRKLKDLDGKKVGFTKMTSFSSDARNVLTSVRVSANSNVGVKTVTLYAKVMNRTRIYNGNSLIATPENKTEYVNLGTVTLYPTSISFKLNAPSTIAVGQTATVVAEFNQSGVKADFYSYLSENSYGIAGIEAITSGGETLQNIIRITANETPSSNNRVTFSAFLKTADNVNYILRGSDGLLYTTKSLPQGNNELTVSGGGLLNDTTAKPYSPTSVTNNRWVLEKEVNEKITKVTLNAITSSQTVSISTKAAPTAIRFTQSSYTIEAYDSVSTSVQFTPSNATSSLSYMSGNSAVATVSSSGRITGVAPGTTLITATTTDGSNISCVCTVTVKPATIRLSLNKTAATIGQGGTTQLSATILPTTVTNKTVYWTSSNSAVAKVSSTGLVTGVTPGTAVITCRYAANSAKTATCVITVLAEQPKITLPSSSVSMKVGDIQKIVPTFKGLSSTAVTYKSENPSVVSVSSDGTLVALKEGSAMITVTSVSNPSVSAYCVVTVTKKSTDPTDIDDGVISKTTFKVSGKSWKRANFYSGDIKAALAGDKSVTIELTTTVDNNYLVFTKYAIKRLALYADDLTIEVNGWEYTFDSEDLMKMAKYNRAIGIYCKPGKVNENYKSNGKLKWIGIKPEIN